MKGQEEQRIFIDIPLKATLCVLLWLSAFGGTAKAGRTFLPSSHITRGIYAPIGDLLQTGAWADWGGGYAFDQTVAHGGQASARVETNADVPEAGLAQRVEVNQKEPRPLVISGWSRAQDLSDGADWQYSLYVDLRYTDGTPLYMQVAAFTGGTHDWEFAEKRIVPEKPVATASVYAFIRQRTGTAWFDDLFFGELDGPNLLRNPGFEPGDREDTSRREEFFATCAELHVNAIHTYLGSRVAVWASQFLPRRKTSFPPQAGEGPGEGGDLLGDFLQACAAHGIGVWLTMAPLTHDITDVNDPDFPEYYCVNGRFGEEWTKLLADVACEPLAGLSLVPDEFVWANGRLKRRFANHPDEAVRQFYANLPSECNCSTCQRLFRERTGRELPVGVRDAKEETRRQYIAFRYDSTTAWIKRTAAAVKAVNPNLRADSLICVGPLCLDNRVYTGVAWDRVGYETDIDFLTTDPYILLHNYLGDSTHWYVTETTVHLVGAGKKRQAGVVLEASRLRAEHRELDPVEVYGSALSAVAHGARELAFWHWNNVVRGGVALDREATYRNVQNVYALLKRIDPWFAGAKPLKRLAFLYSRASDDYFQHYVRTGPPPWLVPQTDDPRYPFRAQQEVLYALFRRGIPTDLFYLDSVRLEELRDYPLLIVPFPFALSDAQADLLRAAVERGQNLLVLSAVGRVDEHGNRRDRPALLDLLGLKEPPPFSAVPRRLLDRRVGRGRVMYLTGDFTRALTGDPATWQDRSRQKRVVLPPLAEEARAVLEGSLTELGGVSPSLLEGVEPPQRDVEVAALINAAGDLVLFAINWEREPVRVRIRLPKGPWAAAGEAWALAPDRPLREETWQAAEEFLSLRLAGQEAQVGRFSVEAR
ncbi:MAG TPA: hypothetical protein EYP85_15755 [Armatimonadetes bacterium]|nr:hypothetical protein [Armatimonadota bacterium]